MGINVKLLFQVKYNFSQKLFFHLHPQTRKMLVHAIVDSGGLKMSTQFMDDAFYIKQL